MGIRYGGLFHQALVCKGGEFGGGRNGVGIQGIEQGDHGDVVAGIDVAQDGKLQFGHVIKSFQGQCTRFRKGKQQEHLSGF